MRVSPIGIAGPMLLTPDVHFDDRGFFVETFRSSEAKRAGIRDDFVQQSQSRSVIGTLRGLHFQAPPGQAKLVRVARGAIHDVVVDIRRTSPNFGHHAFVRLDDTQHHQLYIPAGFAHGFCVLSDAADVIYSVSRYYDPALERGLAWDDPELAIDWPTHRPLVSERDHHHPTLRHLDRGLTSW